MVAATVLLLGGARAATQPAAPTGMTGIALDGRVELAWQPVSGADHYSVYRGTSVGAITTLVTPAGGVTGTSFADTTTANGTTYYYVARAVAAGTESVSSGPIQSTPAPRSCSAGNPVVLENCYPGTNTWTLGTKRQQGRVAQPEGQHGRGGLLQRVRLPKRLLRGSRWAAVRDDPRTDGHRTARLYLRREHDRSLRLLELVGLGHDHDDGLMALRRLHRQAAAQRRRRRERNHLRRP
jgi:hypothetical protein